LEAATQLRLGRSAAVVLARIREQSPTLLQDDRAEPGSGPPAAT